MVNIVVLVSLKLVLCYSDMVTSYTNVCEEVIYYSVHLCNGRLTDCTSQWILDWTKVWNSILILFYWGLKLNWLIQNPNLTQYCKHYDFNENLSNTFYTCFIIFFFDVLFYKNYYFSNVNELISNFIPR